MAIRITQAGVGLAVGIIILTGLIVGGFFWVKNSGEQARRNEAIEIAQQNLEEQSKQDDKKDAAGEIIAPENTENPPSNTQDNTSNNDTVAQEASELPRTGVADQLSNTVAISALTFAVVSYIASRRQV